MDESYAEPPEKKDAEPPKKKAAKAAKKTGGQGPDTKQRFRKCDSAATKAKKAALREKKEAEKEAQRKKEEQAKEKAARERMVGMFGAQSSIPAAATAPAPATHQSTAATTRLKDPPPAAAAAAAVGVGVATGSPEAVAALPTDVPAVAVAFATIAKGPENPAAIAAIASYGELDLKLPKHMMVARAGAAFAEALVAQGPDQVSDTVRNIADSDWILDRGAA